MNKATHHGTCQICARTQKLPGGMLSTHGYTTQWGFFNGVCPGSGFKPWEESNARAARDVARVECEIDRLEALAAEVSVETEHAWMNHMVGDTKMPAKVAKADLALDGATLYANIARYGRVRCTKIYEAPRSSLESEIRTRNRLHAAYLKSQAGNLKSYVAWQSKRIANWAPAELTPIAA